MNNNKLITVLGPTAVGKTRFAVRLASKFNGEIISADSRQVYKGMDIGTGKDLEDYKCDSGNIPYHLIDIIDPSDEFNLYDFTERFHSTFNKITAKQRLPFLVGGTGMYLSSILQDYELVKADFNSERFTELQSLSNEQLTNILMTLKPDQHNTTDIIERERIIKAIIIAESDTQQLEKKEIEHLVIGIKEDRETVKKRITARLKHRLEQGMIEEVEDLLKKGITIERLKLFGLEYKFIAMYLNDEINYNDMYQKLNSAIHKFAKRQMTWFRKMEREEVAINWLKASEHEKAVNMIKDFVNG